MEPDSLSLVESIDSLLLVLVSYEERGLIAFYLLIVGLIWNDDGSNTTSSTD